MRGAAYYYWLASSSGPAAVLEGAVAGSATVSAAITTRKTLGGSVSGAGTTAAAITTRKTLAGGVSGTAIITAAFSGTSAALAGDIAGAATIAASLTAQIALGGSVSGTATTTADITTRKTLAGSVSGNASIAATVTTGILLAGYVAGNTTVAPAALITRSILAGNIAGSAAASAALTATMVLPEGAMLYTDIRSAFTNRLKTLPALPDVAWEDRSYTPVTNRPYLEPALLPAEAKQVTIGTDGLNEESGIYQIALKNYPRGHGTGEILIAAGVVRSWFKRGMSLTYNNITVTIRKSYISPPDLSDPRGAQIIVSVAYYAQTSN